MTVSWRTYSHPTGGLNRFMGSQPSRYLQKLYNQQDKHLKICKYTQRHKLRTAYPTNDYRGKWTVIY